MYFISNFVEQLARNKHENNFKEIVSKQTTNFKEIFSKQTTNFKEIFSKQTTNRRIFLEKKQPIVLPISGGKGKNRPFDLWAETSSRLL